MLSQNSVQTPRITHAYRLVGPQDRRSEAASSPPGNHISSSNEAELEMVLVRKTPARIDHRNRSERRIRDICHSLPPAKKLPRSLPTHLVHPSTYATSIIYLHGTSLTDRESPT